jgi:uncharacterized protein
MIKVFVFDTNVIISAHLLQNSESRKAFNLAQNIGIFAYSRETLHELETVFFRPKFNKYVSIEEREKAIQLFISRGIEFKTTSKFDVCRDQKDNMLLDLAVDCNAACLISGDADLLTLNPFKELLILSPSEFSQRFGI